MEDEECQQYTALEVARLSLYSAGAHPFCGC